MSTQWDVAVVGAGAAGMMAAIVAAGEGVRVALIDSQRKLGAKILVSGGGRCNVTNAAVDERHFHGGSPGFIRRVLQRFPADATVSFFDGLGVALKTEPSGKLFPVSDSARTVLDALLAEAGRLGVEIVRGEKVCAAERIENGFQIRGDTAEYCAGALVLATGGLSLPKTGSDGSGYGLAEAFGHQRVPTSPALAPLRASPDGLSALSGITLPVRLTLVVGGKTDAAYTGSFLFTHFGYSGPAALNLSRHWIRARWATREVGVFASFLPALNPEDVAAWLQGAERATPRRSPAVLLSERLPARLAECLVVKAGIPAGRTLGRILRTERAALVRALTALELPVIDALGYEKAEATAGGIALDDMEPGTLGSRLTEGLYLAGEMLDVDGLLGGYNFQWAWSSGRVAGRAAARHALGRVMRGRDAPAVIES